MNQRLHVIFATLLLVLLVLPASATAPEHQLVQAGGISVQAILRPNRNPPTANTYVIYDDHQVLVVDVGKVYNDTLAIVAALDPLLKDGARRLNAFFLTHGHPDHVGNVWRMAELYPTVPLYVGNAGVHTETVTLMRVFGNFLNLSSPGNPDGNAPDRFPYASRRAIRILTSPEQLWHTPPEALLRPADAPPLLRVLTNEDTARLGESNHYAWLEFRPTADQLWVLGGDLVYVNTHVYMGFGVSLMAQCDWANVLLTDWTKRYGSEPLLSKVHVTLFPGHGPPTSDLLVAIGEHLAYMEYVRRVFVNTCSPSDAFERVMSRYSRLNDVTLLQAYTIPYRVPYDALNLGCKCVADAPPSCGITPPTCLSY
eukprot:CAMPEP_0177649286 /NCGR_PEP_ID=MMETSP0447-20121125/11299_1 /TAXON_ID=0 /ORGANISM="Stygamoeba regulata, Strain BSH-02190019" /LENGTH=368 /DNA_ID=CAMNT_0019152021 /DNA_START=79 /DNA_END=1185 /DNA_ORIENTATION=+